MYYLIIIFSSLSQKLEIEGNMRFYFQDDGEKVATKCIRVSSTATTHDVVETLIEKFRPDIKMLSKPEYALYEVHENGGMFFSFIKYAYPRKECDEVMMKMKERKVHLQVRMMWCVRVCYTI